MALTLALAQVDLRVGALDDNVAQIVAVSRRAREEGADAVVFPELALTGYPPEDLLMRPGFIRRAGDALRRVAAEVVGLDVILGHPEADGALLYNAASVLRGGRVVATYRKHELPNYSVFDEKRHFQAGDVPCVIEIAGVPVGLSICEDAWHPGVAAASANAGARLLVNLNASPFHAGKQVEREAAMRARQAEAPLPIAYVNLVGGQDELVFDGGSFVLDASGEVVARAEAFRAELLLARFDVEQGVPLARSGRLATLGSETASIYDALVLGVRDYVGKNGFPGAVLGLSGGIDSALTLAIASDALGADRVEAVLMPSRYTARMSIDDAEAEADTLGVAHRLISIEPAFETYLEMLAEAFAGKPPDTTEENLQARCRGVVLMALSNKSGRILLSTGNKSEMAVGYATLYGDMAGGFAPLKDVPKTLVYRLAEYRNTVGEVIPRRVIERAPSAELAPDQQDSDSLPPYDMLDAILERFVERDQCQEEIVAAGFDPQTVRRVINLVVRNEYKRRQGPPGVRISRKAFGRDRRYPITSGYGAS
ncbi:MAG: NAD+ synthase [Gammaproteobacteria bacterium]|nr:NAD+ synthase [Gammaproteobacteria bacterium]